MTSGVGVLGRPLCLRSVRNVDAFRAGFGAELGLRRVELGLVDVPQCDQSTLGDEAAGDAQPMPEAPPVTSAVIASNRPFAATFNSPSPVKRRYSAVGSLMREPNDAWR
jgi:hypothetical protein